MPFVPLQKREQAMLAETEAKALALGRLRLIEMERRRKEEAENNLHIITPTEVGFAAAYPLREFIADTWHILEYGRIYKSGFHIDAIAEHLEACSKIQIKNLIINIPPRCMKSLLVCVMWFCWTWTWRANTRWIYSSYSGEFAKRDSEKCRNLIKSEYYQKNFGSAFHLLPTQNEKKRFENNRTGFRLATGVLGQGTGEGADFIICDDPHKQQEAASVKKIESVQNWWHHTMTNRINDPENAVRVIIMQRLTEDDLTGDILAKELDYEHLCLPMKWDEGNQFANTLTRPTHLGKVSAFDVAKNPKLELNAPKVWIDPRSIKSDYCKNNWYREWKKAIYAKESAGEDELLFPNHFSEASVKELEDSLEIYGASAQLQQSPTPKGGGFFKEAHFNENLISLDEVPLDNLILVDSWDKAGSDDAGDWTCGVLIGRTKTMPYTFYILDVKRARVSVYKRMAMMKKAAEYHYSFYANNGLFETWFRILIEEEPGSAGKDMSALERDDLIGFSVSCIRPSGNKTTRATPFQTGLEANRVKIVKAPWTKDFIREFCRFIPHRDNKEDNQVDGTSQGFNYLLRFKLPGNQRKSVGLGR